MQIGALNLGQIDWAGLRQPKRRGLKLVCCTLELGLFFICFGPLFWSPCALHGGSVKGPCLLSTWESCSLDLDPISSIVTDILFLVCHGVHSVTSKGMASRPG